MAVNHDGTRLATGSADTVVRLWQIGPKEGFASSCRSHNSRITLLEFHPTQPYLFSSALGDYNVAVWHAETGKKEASLEAHQSLVTDIAFSNSGDVIATLDACTFLPHGALENHLGVSVSESDLLLTGGQWGCLRIWDVVNGLCVLEVKGPLDRATLLGTDEDKTRQSVDYGLHSIVQLRVTQTDEVVGGSSESEEEIKKMVSKLVLVRQSDHVEFYDPMTAKRTAECLGDIGQVDQLCIVGKNHNRLLLADASPQLKLFVCPPGLSPDYEGQPRSWSCHLVPGGHTDVVTDTAVSGCGQWVVSCAKDRSICLWAIVETPGGEQQAPKVRVALVHRIDSAHAAHVSAVCFNRSTNLLFSASEDNDFKAWTLKLPSLTEIASGHLSDSNPPVSEWSVVTGAHNGSINAIDVAVNDRMIATASRDKTIKLWTVGKRRLECAGVLQGHRRGVWSVQFSAIEKVVLTASGDGDVKLWNLKDFSCMRTFEGHDQPVYKAVFLSNDQQILSCDQKGNVRLWTTSKPGSSEDSPADAEDDSGKCKVFEAHEGRIWSIVVCSDESGFFTGGEDETLCHFQDITEQVQAERQKKQESFIQTRQLLDNLVKENRLGEALSLSVRLNQPKRALDLLQGLLLSDNDGTDVLGRGPKERRSKQIMKLESALNGLLHNRTTSATTDESSEQLVQRLLGYTVNWNTRSRTSVVAQCVLNWVLSTWAPEELVQWPGFTRTVESLLPYATRHYQRISRLEEQLAILDYLCDLADEHQVIESSGRPNEKSIDDDDNSLSLVHDLNLGMDSGPMVISKMDAVDLDSHVHIVSPTQ